MKTTFMNGMFGPIQAGMCRLTMGGGENIFKYMMLSQMMKGSKGDMGGMNPMAMMMLMNGGGMGNMFDGLFGTSAKCDCSCKKDTGVKEDK